MKIILFIPFYDESNLQRKIELEECLAGNISNPLIEKIVLIADETIPDDFVMPFEKVIVEHFGKRCTFNEIFYEVIPKHTDKNTINIISNSDMLFNESLERLNYIDWDRGIALSCSRWDLKDKVWTVYPTWDSQDYWVLKGFAKEGMEANFHQGEAGSDNKITYELDRVGYWVFNPAKDIMGKHLHSSNVRHYLVNGVPKSMVPPPYKLLHPSDMNVVKQKPLKKIGFIGLPDGITDGMLKDLKYFGEVRFLDFGKHIDNLHNPIIRDKEKFEEEVLELSKWADVLFLKLQFPRIIEYSLAEKIKECNVKIFNFTDDVREEIPLSMINIADVCTTVFTNQTDVDKMKSMNYDSKFMHIGFNPSIYHPKGRKAKSPEIVFMANNLYDTKAQKHIFPLGKERQDLVFFLKETYGDRFGVYGKGWDGLESGDLFDNPMEEASVYRGAKIAINFSNFFRERYTSDRLLRSMGCGCFVLSQDYPLIEKDFELTTYLDNFESFEVLKEKIDYYLEYEDERQRIAKSGCQYVHKNFTWYKSLSELI